MRIALLEDSQSQIDLLTSWLGRAGFKCHIFAYGSDLVQARSSEPSEPPSIEWRLPEISGEAVLARVRDESRTSPPKLSTTSGESEGDEGALPRPDVGSGLVQSGHYSAFLARMESAMRRTTNNIYVDERITLGEFQINISKHKILRHGVEAEITLKDFEFAVYLFLNLGRVLSRTQILEAVWGTHPNNSTRTVATHASRIRSKLGLVPENGWRLMATYKHGYRLEQLPDPQTPTGIAAQSTIETPTP